MRTGRRIILTHWNAGVFHAEALPRLLPELIVFSLLYDEVLIRDEDLLTNRKVMRLLSEPENFAIFSDLLSSGLVKILQLPPAAYPPSRRYDPGRLPFSARAEEHELRRSYKGKPWRPTRAERTLIERLDLVAALHPSAVRPHQPFPDGNPFAAQLAELLEQRAAYRFASHPVFRHIDPRAADEMATLCREPGKWIGFLHDKGVAHPIVGPDAGFYRTAAYQCSAFLAAPRTMCRLVESVYAATYCDREASDGRYGGSDLVEMPYRFDSHAAHESALDDVRRVEVVPTDAVAKVSLRPGVAEILLRTRESNEYEATRRCLDALERDVESPLLSEQMFVAAWRDLCNVFAQHAAEHGPHGSSHAEHRIARFAIYAYVLARAVGMIVLPMSEIDVPLLSPHSIDAAVPADAVLIDAIEKYGPRILSGFRASLKAPEIRERLSASVAVRCSKVSLASLNPP